MVKEVTVVCQQRNESAIYRGSVIVLKAHPQCSVYVSGINTVIYILKLKNMSLESSIVL